MSGGTPGWVRQTLSGDVADRVARRSPVATLVLRRPA
jgi:hypothetical protein